MPRYFFHLSFGNRLLPDEEGVELASRSAARQEAQAVVGELSASVVNRRASWFLRVADEGGQFLSLPLGHPALELVSDDRLRGGAAPWQETAEAARDRARAAALNERAAALFAEVLARRRRTAELLEMNVQLRAELSAQLRFAEAAGTRNRQLAAPARQETPELDIPHAARRSPPHLVLIQGRE